MIEWKDKKIIAEATTTARGSHVEYGKNDMGSTYSMFVTFMVSLTSF